MNNKLTDAKVAQNFLYAGNAIVTLRSLRTGARYTYKVSQSKANPGETRNLNPLFFVSLLTGPENTQDYTYLGVVENKVFRTTRKSPFPISALPVKAFVWTILNLKQNRIPDGLEIWHEGRCGRCGRTLTVPESIESGFGPECIGKLAA